MGDRMIKRLLVANRGEVAVRIMATASVLGIETVAVYPADDAACGHVGRADAAVELPGADAAAYLDVDAIIAAAAGTGCDMLHPGYGFLSERPELAARCAAAGLRFAGPGPEALALFGDKAAARARACELGVPVLAGTGADPSPGQVLALLREHGAVMVKAVAGGGGRGLRPVTREEDLTEAQLADTMRRCASEAAAAFGDGRVFAERLLPRARHVEVQVVGDGTGAVAVLGDRDCSLQRRRQKLIEIAPAALAGEVRARLSAAAAALVRSADYAGLATAEFLVQDDEIAFLEVNPRLQVEHTVTEQVTGLDLVELGLRIADGATIAAVAAGEVLIVLAGSGADAGGQVPAGEVPLDHVRPDLAEVRERHRTGLDEGRPEVTERRHAAGRRTARENIADLADPGSFTEYGALTIAAQRRRRPLDDLIARTPADGLVLGTASVDGRPVAVMSYDYSVLAGTQGHMNHRKTDRLLELAERERLPLVMFAEGGGGRPGDTDTTSVAGLDVPTFRLTARLSGRVPLVAIVSGYCFAGNAALAGACDVIIATPEASLGMGGPAMIEGGGLGVVAPDAVGPMSVQVPNGVVDLLVPDEPAAVAAARRYLSYFRPRTVPALGAPAEPADQRVLRHLIPENRVRSYDVRPVIEALCDTGSVLELRAGFGVGVLTALARIGGCAVGLLASNPRHLGGAIDGDAADKATAFLRLCEAHRLPVVSLVDTPGFMVGPEAERTAIVRRFGAMFVAGARLTVPVCAVVLRKAYGLGAMAMTAGDLRRPAITVAWPTGEFGGMGLEGAVRLGYRKELGAIADPVARRARYEELVGEQYARGKALSTAMAFEIDDVIDPADTRDLLTDVLARAAADGQRGYR